MFRTLSEEQKTSKTIGYKHTERRGSATGMRTWGWRDAGGSRWSLELEQWYSVCVTASTFVRLSK